MSLPTKILTFDVAIGMFSVELYNISDDFYHKLVNRYAAVLSDSNYSGKKIRVLFDTLSPQVKFSLREDTEKLMITLPTSIKGIIDTFQYSGEFRMKPTMRGFNTVLRLMMVLFICQQRGFMLHASSILVNGAALVFYGNQGAGKSTLSKLSGQRILADDTTIILSRDKKFFVLSNPFDVKLPVRKPTVAPLRKCVALSHSEKQQDVLQKRIPEPTWQEIALFVRPSLRFFRAAPSYFISYLTAVQSFTLNFHEFYSLEFSKSSSFLRLL